MIRPSYNLPSRKWISTEILDQVHKEVELEIKKFATETKFLTLSGDEWTNVSKQSMVNFILTNEKRQSQIFYFSNLTLTLLISKNKINHTLFRYICPSISR